MIEVKKLADLNQRIKKRNGFIYAVVNGDYWGKGVSLKEAWTNANKPKKAKIAVIHAAIIFGNLGDWAIAGEDLPKWAINLSNEEIVESLFVNVGTINLR